MSVTFRLKADELKRACEQLGVSPVPLDEEPVEFKLVDGDVWVATLGRWVCLAADVHQPARVCIPPSIVEGLVCMLPYFGTKKIEIGFSQGRMRIHTTVFHNREILVSAVDESLSPASIS